MVEKRGRLGRKNGKGFYDYPQNGPKRLLARPRRAAEDQLDPDKIDIDELKHRLLAIQALESAALRRGGRHHRRARGRRRSTSLRLRGHSPAARSPMSSMMGTKRFVDHVQARKRSSPALQAEQAPHRLWR